MSVENDLNLPTVDDAMRSFNSLFDWGLSPIERTDEQRFLDRFGRGYDVTLRKIPYMRYGSALSDLVGAMFAQNVGAFDLGFTARLTTCGMSAIAAALNLGPQHFLTGESDAMYGLTPALILRLLNRHGGRVAAFEDASNHGAILDSLGHVTSGTRPCTLMFETLGNGRKMPVLDVESLFRSIWDKQGVTFVLDNTLLTCALFNPFDILEKIRIEKKGYEAFRFVYVESLSKYYRADISHDPTSGGIIIVPNRMLKEIDTELEIVGTHMTIPQLRTFPWILMGAPRRMMELVSRHARAAVDLLLHHPKVEVGSVTYPRGYRQFSYGSGGVLYFELKNVSRGAGALLEPMIPFRASFGHAYTTHIDWGAHDDTKPSGLIRLSFGTCETTEEVIVKLDEALKRV
jgi:cystathionine beta-lyase/cystathionine gamma-synthase